MRAAAPIRKSRHWAHPERTRRRLRRRTRRRASNLPTGQRQRTIGRRRTTGRRQRLWFFAFDPLPITTALAANVDGAPREVLSRPQILEYRTDPRRLLVVRRIPQGLLERVGVPFSHGLRIQ